MATQQHTVIIDFQADLSSLQSGIDILEKMGKVDKTLADEFRKTNSEINKQGYAFDKAAKAAGNDAQSFGRLADLLKQFPKSGINRFLLQMGNDLAKAGFKAEDFFKRVRGGGKELDSLQKELAETKTTLATLTSEFEKFKNKTTDTTPKITSLKNELKQVKEEMQQMAVAGNTASESYQKLKQRAGELDDTIKDVASDIANAGSDTRGIDNVVGSISALAGGYSAVQGAAALFGDESEDLQKTLLKVNAAMALATGIQQVSNAVQKEGALARVADTIATGGQIAAQRLYTLVVGQSVGALKVFRIALASTGIGLLVIGVAALISKFSGASSATKNLKKDLEDLRTATDNLTDSIRHQGDVTEAVLNNQGASQSEVSRARLKTIEEIDKAEQNAVNEMERKRSEILNKNKEFEKQGVFIRLGGIKQIDEALDVSIKKQQDLFKESQLLRIKIDGEQQNERKAASDKALSLSKEAAEKALEAAKKQRALEFEDYKAGIELKILAAEKGSEEELGLQKKLLRAKLLIDLEGENLSLNQRKLLIQQFYKDRIEIEKNFNKAIVAAGIEDQKNRDAAALENLNLTESERLAVRIDYLQLGAAQEIDAANGNAAKILAINAKLNSDITALKVASIKAQAEYEIAFSAAQGGGSRRALEGVAANEKLKGDIRINAIRQLAERETQFIDRQIKANRDAAQVQGSDQAALALEYEQLLDQKVAKTEEAESKISDIMDRERQERLLKDQAYINVTVESLRTLTGILETIQQQNQEAADQAFKRKREEIEELLEAGAITEREARERNRRIDLQERQAKQRAAQQQKNLAVFNALLAIPQAYMQGLIAPPPLGGPFYAAVLAGLAAAQAAAIASRPVPKFASGKKGSYSGPGVVGEAGAELIQRADGSMEVATRRQMVYLGSRDKVFTHSETKNLMPFVNKEAMAASNKGESFDYDKLAKAVKQKQGGGTVVNIDKEFISESVANGLSKVNYFDRYYNSRG